MPWVNENLCTSCGVCLDECPVGAITIAENEKASIDDEKCIRCGKCHESCPNEAVRHDKERIPLDVEANLGKVEANLKRYGTTQDRQLFLERMIRYYKKEIKVAEQTIDRIDAIRDGMNV
jgi:ferredoxin